MKETRAGKDNYNYGLAVLKIFMAFEVVLCHYWSWGEYASLPVYLKCLARLRSLAVPTFMIISFFFFTDSVLSRNISVFKKRIVRLLIPYIGWGIAYYICYKLLRVFFKVELLEVGISDLGWQLLLGASRNLDPPLWFQADLIFLTLFIMLIFYFVSTDKSFLALFFLALIALYMQYSGMNYKAFGGWEYETRYTCGRICEMLPYAYIGMMLSYYGIDEKISGIRWRCVIANLSLLMLLWKMPIFSEVNAQFGYAGVNFLCMAISIVIIFMAVPFEKLPYRVLRVVRWFAKYTLGVFCIHFGVGRLLTIWLSKMGFETMTFAQCVIIWIICYIASYFISKIPVKFCAKLVQ